MLMQMLILTAIVLAVIALAKVMGTGWLADLLLTWAPFVLALVVIAEFEAGKTADVIALIAGVGLTLVIQFTRPHLEVKQ